MNAPETTLLASELIKVLQEMIASHGDLPARVTYEGISREIGVENVYPGLAYTERGRVPAILIDGDGNHYKAEFQKDGGDG